MVGAGVFEVGMAVDGTCMLTAVGLCKSLEEAKKLFVSEKKMYVPNSETAKIYKRKYGAYKKNYEAVIPIIALNKAKGRKYKL